MIDWEEFYQSFRKPGFIPGYEIQNRLGGGAFGEVYKARKTSIGKPYAIKFLKVDDQAGREAIEKELDHVRHFAQIDHPNLVTIEDMGVVLGVPYLIMGYAGEDTLARRLKRERLSVERALHYFTQVARGVLALHDRRLVHFDLKPSNVFLKGEIARVGDYGLAKLMTEGRATLSFGRGTPHYMAPEMLKNRADHRADIYSLGVILYESLTGALPFDEEPGGGFVVRETDEPPQFPPEFPIPLRGVVERALRLDPALRHANVEELIAELGQTGRQGDSIVVPRELAGTSAHGGARAGTLDERTPPPTPALTPPAHSASPGPVADRPSPEQQSPSPSTPSTPPASGAPAAAVTAQTPTPGLGAAPAAHAPSPAKPGVARAASRELARGAAEVALGVW
ncbi:MAG: serine/threonine protein kinase, partial [Planctomycetes bacterium]|nr:serine/threonine protein kinase [Planctomycetota bacterium]